MVWRFPVVLCILMSGFPAFARIESVRNVSGVGGMVIAAPDRALDEAVGSDTHMLGFDERQNVLLNADLAVDGGVIAAGTRVSSHMILLNVLGAAWGAGGVNDWTFSEPIVGVMSDVGGTLEAASTGVLGAPGTAYPNGYPFRGLESEDGYRGVGATTLRTFFGVWQPGDWIRVVTAPRPVARHTRPARPLGHRATDVASISDTPGGRR